MAPITEAIIMRMNSCSDEAAPAMRENCCMAIDEKLAPVKPPQIMLIVHSGTNCHRVSLPRWASQNWATALSR